MYSLHNIHFKQPTQSQPDYLPPPPIVEPLSPSNYRPRPIEPSFNYPAVARQATHALDHPVAHQHTTPTSEWRDELDGRKNGEKRGHHRKLSSMDALADAALAMNPPKRARTDTYAPVHTMYEQMIEQQRQHREQMQRLEAAAMLINFRGTDARMQPQQWHDIQRPVSDSFVHGNARLIQEEQRPRTMAATTFQHYQIPETWSRRDSSNGVLIPGYDAPAQAIAAAKDPSAKKPRKRAPKASSAVMSSHKDSMPASLPSPPSNSIMTPISETSDDTIHAVKRRKMHQPLQIIQQVRTPPEELDRSVLSTHMQAFQVPRLPSLTSTHTLQPAQTLLPKRRGWPKGKPRGPNLAKASAPKRKRKTANKAEPVLARRSSFTDIPSSNATAVEAVPQRSRSVPREVAMIIRKGPSVRRRRIKTETSCAGCRIDRKTATAPGLELDEWISCNGCKQWFHLDCAGFRSAEVRDVDKFFCTTCEPSHGKTTYVRKSRRAHTSVDYAELQKGVLKTSDESTEHHYIQPIKDGTFVFDPETFPRIRPELLTKEYLERAGFNEPICIPAAWNSRPWDLDRESEAVKQEDGEVNTNTIEEVTASINGVEFEFDCVADEGQDALDMIMPKSLTVRKVCNLVGAFTPLDVIDVKTQNSGAKWNLARWADYYESNAEDKPVRNVISLEVSHTKLGRLLRRPKVVRDIDLQDQVWPQEEVDKGKWPKVQYYCLMSIADSYTDFHIDFGGSSVYYHLIKGKKTFFFIPPKAKHLKAYEEWNNNPQQNFTFLPHITKECYRVDLNQGDTMLIPSGWIHAVWTPETSLVIGGNFLTRMSFGNQFRVAEIEKNNETPQKFRYPFFQRLMWWTAIDYMERDPMPPTVEHAFLSGQQFTRERPIWQDFDDTEDRIDTDASEPEIGYRDARYYSQAELDGLPELVNFIFRTVLISQGCMDGITPERVKRVAAGIPVSKRHDGPLHIAKAFALWVAWKRGNENPPAWAHPSAVLPAAKDEKKLSARAIKDLERKEAIEARAKQREDRQAKRANKHSVPSSADAGDRTVFEHDHEMRNTPEQRPWTEEYRQPDAAFQNSTTLPATNGAFVYSALEFQTSNSMNDNNLPPQSPPMLSFHQDSSVSSNNYSPPATTPMSQHTSTPKTSVLGPRRIACDPCRRRRIKCKHKDFVIQASPESMSPQTQPYGMSGSDESSLGRHQLDGAYETAVYGTLQPQHDLSTMHAPFNSLPAAVHSRPSFDNAYHQGGQVSAGPHVTNGSLPPSAQHSAKAFMMDMTPSMH